MFVSVLNSFCTAYQNSLLWLVCTLLIIKIIKIFPMKMPRKWRRLVLLICYELDKFLSFRNHYMESSVRKRIQVRKKHTVSRVLTPFSMIVGFCCGFLLWLNARPYALWNCNPQGSLWNYLKSVAFNFVKHSVDLKIVHISVVHFIGEKKKNQFSGVIVLDDCTVCCHYCHDVNTFLQGRETDVPDNPLNVVENDDQWLGNLSFL